LTQPPEKFMKHIDHEQRAHHSDFPPSSFPALAKCPCYKSSDTVGAAAKRGTRLHEKLESLLGNGDLRKLLKRPKPDAK
jgi:hypothetical protein